MNLASNKFCESGAYIEDTELSDSIIVKQAMPTKAQQSLWPVFDQPVPFL